MKGTENHSLSTYLLEKAGSFVLYPQRNRSSAVRAAFDKMRRQMVEWRKTFAPQAPQYDPNNEIVKILGSPTSLDEFYCREMLTAIPEIVDRTLKLSHFTLPDIPDLEFIHLREAANCYILGLPLAAAALARAAVEEALRKELETTVDRKVVAEADLTKLINVYASKSLSKEGRKLANEVRKAGNKVLHQQGPSSASALEAIEAARKVILELKGKTKPPSAS